MNQALLVDHFAEQAGFCDALGSPFTARLIEGREGIEGQESPWQGSDEGRLADLTCSRDYHDGRAAEPVEEGRLQEARI